MRCGLRKSNGITTGWIGPPSAERWGRRSCASVRPRWRRSDDILDTATGVVQVAETCRVRTAQQEVHRRHAEILTKELGVRGQQSPTGQPGPYLRLFCFLPHPGTLYAIGGSVIAAQFTFYLIIGLSLWLLGYPPSSLKEWTSWVVIILWPVVAVLTVYKILKFIFLKLTGA